MTMIRRLRFAGCPVAVATLAVLLATPTPAQASERDPAERAPWITAAGHPAEGKIDVLLAEPKLEMRQVFRGERFPNVAVAVDGTVLATWGTSSVRVRRSEDGGRTWPLKRLVFDGPGAYSSLDAGRPETSSEEWIYLHFEGGPDGGSTVARFNLSWLLDGQQTGDGKLPAWLE